MPEPTEEFYKLTAALTQHLPRNVAARVGNVIVRWAAVEYGLWQMLCFMLHMPDELANVVVARPNRTEELVTRIQEILSLAGLEITFDHPEIDFGVLQNGLAATRKMRDQLAHGVFIEHPPGKFSVLEKRGKWQFKDRNNIRRHVMPGMTPLTDEYWANVDSALNGSMRAVQELQVKIWPLLGALREKFPPPIPPDLPTEDQRQSKESGQPPSSSP